MRRLLLALALSAGCVEADARPLVSQRRAPSVVVATPYVNAKSVEFGGSNEDISVGDIATGGATRVVVSLWSYQANVVSTETLFGKWTTLNSEIKLDLNATASTYNILFQLSGDGIVTTRYVSADNVLAENAWVHICASFDGAGVGNAGRAKVWGNGVELPATGGFLGTIPASLYNGTANAYLGTQSPGSGPTAGLIDEPAIWIGGTPPSCETIYNSRVLVDLPTSFSPAPTHCWNMNEATNVTVPDSCGAATGTPANMEAGDFAGTNVAP